MFTHRPAETGDAQALTVLQRSLCVSYAYMQEVGNIWLTPRDVMELATYHQEVTILFCDIKGFTSMVS